jgi:hypothetical protein
MGGFADGKRADLPTSIPACVLRLGNQRRHNGRCKVHGGKSTGPRTPEGLERGRRANWKHGQFSRKAKAERFAPAGGNTCAPRAVRLDLRPPRSVFDHPPVGPRFRKATLHRPALSPRGQHDSSGYPCCGNHYWSRFFCLELS